MGPELPIVNEGALRSVRSERAGLRALRTGPDRQWNGARLDVQRARSRTESATILLCAMGGRLVGAVASPR